MVRSLSGSGHKHPPPPTSSSSLIQSNMPTYRMPVWALVATMAVALLAAGATAAPHTLRLQQLQRQHQPQQQMQDAAEPPLDVVVVGAGLAGVAAAERLSAFGASRLVVLEAANRTGGRVHATNFGDPTIKRITIELGANWVHGIGPRNPVWTVATALDPPLRTHEVKGSTTNLSNYAVYEHGRPAAEPELQTRVADMTRAFNCANATSTARSTDESFVAVGRGARRLVGRALRSAPPASRDHSPTGPLRTSELPFRLLLQRRHCKDATGQQ